MPKKLGTQKVESASRSMKRGTPQSRSDTKVTTRTQTNVVGRSQARPVGVAPRTRSTK